MTSKWLSRTKGLRDNVDARLCQLRINVGKEAVTSYAGDDGSREDHVVIPGYYIAEWLAEQWWSLLWEPRKSEDQGDHPDFKERHCLLSAQHGYALPSVTFTPTGDQVSIYAGARRSDLAEVRFDRTGEALVPRPQVEEQLRSFVEDTLRHMDGIDKSPLHEAWDLIRNTTDEDAVFFCRLIGSLGLSPYEEHPAIERALDGATQILSAVQMTDLCATSLVSEIVKNAFIACHAQKALEAAPLIDLGILSKVAAPKDIYAHPAFQTGYRGAHRLREYFSISDRDVSGAGKVFRELGLDGKAGMTSLPTSETKISGATQRTGDEGRISVVPTSPPARRFATARGAYLCWTSIDERARLITNAATREQQASRAFAAELVMPRAYVKSQADGNRLSLSKIGEISDREVVAFDTIKFQAQNAGLQLVH